MARGLRILCTGDFHVGRRPSRVGSFVAPERCSCAAMFGEVVELAIREKVDAVVISGDIVDKENKFHEAYGPIERGLRRLAAADIEVFAVAGNHDFDVLPRLAAEVGKERFHLLGPAGTWESRTFRPESQLPLQIVGWSFPAEHVADNPLRTFRPDEFASAGRSPLMLGILHADLDQLDSKYAPVALRDLQAAPCAVWILGHVHRPMWSPQNRCAGVLYPGSPQAMDPGEMGTHGPWLLSIADDGIVAAEQIPLAIVRYEFIELDMTGIDTREAFDAFLPHQLRTRLSQSCLSCGPLEFCSVRIRLTGPTKLHGQLKIHCNEVREQLDLMVERFRVRIDDVSIDTRPQVDLAHLAAGTSVVAELAKLMLRVGDVQASDGDVGGLVRNVSDVAEQICSARAYQPLSQTDCPPPKAGEVRTALLRQGMTLLDVLLRQREQSDPATQAGAR